MKKVLSTIAALGLVAGLASTASAVEFKMSGKYMVEGVYMSDYTDNTIVGGGPGENAIMPIETSSTNNPSTGYYLHTFEVRPTMQVNDKISMSSVIRLADDTMWGGQTDGDTDVGRGIGNDFGGAAGDVYVQQLYMDYASPIGKMRFGRVSAGNWGTPYQDWDNNADRIIWWPSFLASGPLSTQLYIQKSVDNSNIANESAYDSDKYVARVHYKTEALNAGLEYAYGNNLSTGANVVVDPLDPLFSVTDRSDVKQDVAAFAVYNFANYFVAGEMIHYFGKVDFDDATPDQDYDSWGGLAMVGGKFDALSVSLAYMYNEGDDMNSNDKENVLNATGASAGTGDMFEPLYILTGRHTGILNNDVNNGLTAASSTAGAHAVVLAADYAVSNQMTLHGAVGWAQADEELITNQDLDYGWEYNVGAAYKLLDNLTYEAHFGYLDAGDFFNLDGTADISNNVYILTHSLTMTF